MRIYVGNLTYRSNAEDVRKAFAHFGEVASVELAIDPATGRSAGFAFVEMPVEEQAQLAISKLTRKEINSRVVSVHAAADVPAAEMQPPRDQRDRKNDRRNNPGRSDGQDKVSPWARRKPPQRR
jgi:RNA recognition motif-containing protein